MMNNNTNLFKRQYYIGPEVRNVPEHWNQTKITGGLIAVSDPDLDVIVVKGPRKTIAVLGFILDPFDTKLTNEKVVRKLFSESDTFQKLLFSLHPMGGRYVIVSIYGKILRILTDPAGFRQVFYSRDSDGQWWFASQPSLLSETLGLGEDDDIRNDLTRIKLFKNTKEYWFPGRITLYKDILHLTPNHFFDLRKGFAERYWPPSSWPRLPESECVGDSAQVLKGLMESAAERFTIALGLTSGLDTRVILAASRTIADKVIFFTHTHEHLTETNPDITVPQAMAHDFGLSYDVVKYDLEVPSVFRKTFSRNVTFARENKLLQSYAIGKYFEKLGRNYLVTNGICGEITRNFYRIHPFVKVNSNLLVLIAFMKGSKYANKEFTSWFHDLLEHHPECSIVFDLFYWEQRNANWAAMTYSEYDIVFDSFSPFNCRRVLENFLRTSRKNRMPPKYPMHREVIAHLWPELLDYPINPPSTLQERVFSTLKTTRFYGWMRLLKLLKRYHFDSF